MTEYTHLSPSAIAKLALSKTDRMISMRDHVFIEHDRLTPILNEIEFLRYQPVRERAPGLALIGPPGSGKTRLISAIVRRIGDTPGGKGATATRRVLVLDMTQATHARTLYNRLLKGLECPNLDRFTGSDRERVAIDLCKRAGVRMLVLDELQDVLRISPRQRDIALDTIKFLMNELMIPVLVAGTESVQEALAFNPHLNQRFAYRALPVWGPDAYLERLLSAKESSLALVKPSGLASAAMMKSLLDRTGGRLQDLMELIEFAAIWAVETGEEAITDAMLDHAKTGVPRSVVLAMRAREEGGALPQAA